MIDHFTRLDQTLAVGRCPTREERPWLRDQGLTGVLTLQSDADLELREIDWSAWIRDYAGMGIAADRVAVTDFDRLDLLGKLDEAVAAQQIMKYEVSGQAIVVYIDKLEPGETLTVRADIQAGLAIDAQSRPSSSYLYYAPEVSTDAPSVGFIVQ